MNKHYHVIHGDIDEAGIHPDLFRSDDADQALSFFFTHALRYVNNLEELFPGEALSTRAQLEERFNYAKNPTNRSAIEIDGIVIYTDNNESALCLFPCDELDCSPPILKGQPDAHG